MTAATQQIIDRYQGIAGNPVMRAVERAAARTGADFSFLMEKAAVESGFNPAAKAKSSSAVGLFQFIESTWLSMVKDHGGKYGLAALADQIKIRDGRPCVSDCKARSAILGLRENPEISALMAGELSARNRRYLEAHTRGDIGSTELYLAHFLGAEGAARFLNGRAENGGASAPALFPQEARANKNVFFDAATGQARTLDGIYAAFAEKFGPEKTKTAARPAPVLSASSAPSFSPLALARMLFSFDAETRDDARNEKTGFFRGAAFSAQKISADNIFLLSAARHS